MEKKRPNASKLEDHSNLFYTLIPHEVGFKRLPVIKDKKLLNEKIKLGNENKSFSLEFFFACSIFEIFCLVFPNTFARLIFPVRQRTWNLQRSKLNLKTAKTANRQTAFLECELLIIFDNSC